MGLIIKGTILRVFPPFFPIDIRYPISITGPFFKADLRGHARVSRYELLMLWRRLDADGSGEAHL